jgi:hypothetical protein
MKHQNGDDKPRPKLVRFIPTVKAASPQPLKTKIEEIDDIVISALADIKDAKDVYLGVVTDYQAATIRANTGIVTNGFKKTISAEAISHSFKKHGLGTETKEYQVGITDADFRQIPDILVAPGKIADGGKNKFKQDVILFSKEINGKIYFAAMSVREKRRELSFSTLYIHKR